MDISRSRTKGLELNLGLGPPVEVEALPSSKGSWSQENIPVVETSLLIKHLTSHTFI